MNNIFGGYMLSYQRKCCTNSFTQRRHIVPKLQKRIARCLPGDAVLYDYIDTYSTLLCAGETAACIQNMIVPAPEEQMRILQLLFEVNTKVNTHGLDGVFMKLIIMHDDDAISSLIDVLQIYDTAKDAINAIIRYSQKIPFDPSNNAVVS